MRRDGSTEAIFKKFQEKFQLENFYERIMNIQEY